MAWFTFALSLSFLLTTIVIVQRSSYAVSNVDRKLKHNGPFSFLGAISSFSENSQEAVDELHCPEQWSRFGYSCYFLSSYVSTIAQANPTCSLFHLKDSRLMYVQHTMELFYAAHVLTKNNLHSLLLEVDRDLMKDGKIVNMLSTDDYIHLKEFEKKMVREENDINRDTTNAKVNKESTATTVGVKMNHDDKDQNRFENVNDIHEICHQINWNVVNEDLPILILAIELESNQPICSLSNAEQTSAYSHLCQYALDRCLNNIICGKRGRCVNTQGGFNCSCSFLSDGLFCEKWSHKDIQIVIAFIVVIITILVTFELPRNLLLDFIKWFIKCYHGQPSTPPPPPPKDETNDPTIEEEKLSPEEKKNEFQLEKDESRLRKIFVIISTIFFFFIFFKLPAIHPLGLISMHNTSLPKINSSADDNIHTIEQYIRYVILRIDNIIFLCASGLLVTLFSILNRQEKRKKHEDDDRSGLIEPLKLLRITDRCTTTAIVIIQMFEILDVLEGAIIDIDKSAQFGIFAQIFQRIFFVILIALRHYPTLASLQFQNFFVRLLIVVYFGVSTTYLTLFGNSEMHWLSIFLKLFPSKKEDFYINLGGWSFAHSLTRNIMRYILIGYICAELIMRLLYDSTHIAWKRGRTIFDIPHRTIDQYSFRPDWKKKCFVRKLNQKLAIEVNGGTANDRVDHEGFLISIRNNVKSIYPWDKTFRFTTITICTYTVAFIFLFHLTGIVILLYQTQTNSYIQYIKQIFRFLLNIEMKENSFQIEVIITAIITMIIYGIQLVLSLKNFKNSMGNLYTRFSEQPELSKKLEKREIIRKSTQYPSYLLLYLLGGYFICFHLILFFIIMISKVIFTHISLSQGTVGYITPILLVYLLQKMVIQWLHYAFDCFDQRNEKDLDLKLNIFDSILLYLKLISCSFIGVIASIIRLIFSVLVNILFMPRIDYSYLVEPLQGLDSAHESFQSFLRLEILCVHPLILEFSPSVQPVSTPGAPTVNESNVVELPETITVPEGDDGSSIFEGQSPEPPRRATRCLNEPIPLDMVPSDDESIQRLLA